MLAQRRQMSLVNGTTRENIVLARNPAKNADNGPDVLFSVFVLVLSVIGDQ